MPARRPFFTSCSQKGWSTEKKKAWMEVFLLTGEIRGAHSELIANFPKVIKAVTAAYRRRHPEYDTETIRYFNYLQGNFVLRATAHRDKVFQLVNVFLHLGIPPKRVNHDLILEMNQVATKKRLFKQLELIGKDPLLIDITEISNQLKHRFRPSTGRKVTDIFASIHFIRNDWSIKDALYNLTSSVKTIKKYTTRIYHINDRILKMLTQQ